MITILVSMVNRNITRNEKTNKVNRVSNRYFTFHNSKWVFVNQKLTSMKDVTEDKEIPPIRINRW
jgi:hypothetical protein